MKKFLPLIILAGLAILALKFLRPGAAAAEPSAGTDPLDDTTSRNVDDDDTTIVPPMPDDPALPTTPAAPAAPTSINGIPISQLEESSTEGWGLKQLELAARGVLEGTKRYDKAQAKFIKQSIRREAREELAERRDAEKAAAAAAAAAEAARIAQLKAGYDSIILGKPWP